MNHSPIARSWRTRALVLLCLTTLLALIRHNTSSALTNPQDETEVCSQVRADLFRAAGAFSYLHPQSDVIATARISGDNQRRVEVDWQLYSGDGFWMRDIRAFETQTFAVRYIPTAAEFLNGGFLAVAGCLGDTNVIELWELPVPKVQQDPATGEVQLTPGARKSVRLIYRSSTGSSEGTRGFARRMIWNRGKPRALFCLFSETSDIFEVTWPETLALGTTTVIVSKSDYPELAINNYDSVHGGDHVSEGFVYQLARAGSLDLVPSLVMIDANRDGVIDIITLLDAAGDDALELRDVSRWSEYAGLDTPW